MNGAAGVPIISVIVPSYNKPEYLPECLESIRAQTFTDWECIVVSDGSPRVEEIRAAVAAMGDERFRLVEHKENRGLAAARNTGVRESRADLVICVDEDDRLHAESLSRLLQHMDRTGAWIVCPQGRYFGGKDGIRACRMPTLEEILHTQPLLLAGSLIRKEVFAQVGLYDEHPVIKLGREDHEWWIRVVSGRVHIEVSEEELYWIRRPEEEDNLLESLDFLACKNERRIYQYILQKHRSLYHSWPQQKRAVLRKAWLREANYFKSCGRTAAAIARLYGAAWQSRLSKDWRAAVKATMDVVFGRKVAVAILTWRRRWVAGRG